MFGFRNPEIYGSETLNELMIWLENRQKQLIINLNFINQTMKELLLTPFMMKENGVMQS